MRIFYKLGWQFFLAFFSISALSVLFTTWYSMDLYNKLFLTRTVEDITKRAVLFNKVINFLPIDSSSYLKVDSLCKILSTEIATRATIILPSGRVIGDTDKDPIRMENHRDRPEIMNALSGDTGVQKRFSTTLNEPMLYVAIPMKNNDSVTYVLRLAVSMGDIRDQEKIYSVRMALSFTVMILLIGLASTLISRQLSRPVKMIKQGAQMFAMGNLDFKLPEPPEEELAGLTRALNSMASTLDERMKLITRQRNELNTILSSMTEGVIAVDAKEKIISMNPAAAKILGVQNQTIEGQWLHDIVRNSTLQRFVLHILSNDTKIETTFTLPDAHGEIHIHASGVVLNDGPGGPQGAVLVLNDITRLIRLENARKDFVANVSHELRTPLTSIKGFLETIHDGNYPLPDEVNKFLEIISSKTSRLCSIIEDILSLSSIERDHEHREITFTESNLRIVLDSAVENCLKKASSKKIKLTIESKEDFVMHMNAQLLEQAVVNLIDNAVKYSDEGKEVIIRAVKTEKAALITVEDQGIGISSEHLSRVFERFYRVDKARSRKLGGTGLGLSIVKNIIIAHGGSIDVKSEPGKGSIFSMSLPLAPAKS
ncbi:MAG TPA: ATP-binding protein [Chitinispirillaceae bacterium]|nr:ATP-binding protein [Chitinispirillaceae bacterium]